MLSSFAVALFIRYSVFFWAEVNNLLDVRPKFPSTLSATLVVSPRFNNIEIIVIPLALILSGLVELSHIYSNGDLHESCCDQFRFARVSGIRISVVVVIMWIISRGLAGIGGAFLGIYTVGLLCWDITSYLKYSRW